MWRVSAGLKRMPALMAWETVFPAGGGGWGCSGSPTRRVFAPLRAGNQCAVKRFERKIAAEGGVAPARPAHTGAELAVRIIGIEPQIPVLYGFGFGASAVVAVGGEHVMTAAEGLEAAGEDVLEGNLFGLVVGAAAAAGEDGAVEVLPDLGAVKRDVSPRGDARVPCRTTHLCFPRKSQTACVACATHPTPTAEAV